MTHVSIEPPRRDLLVHHTYNDVESDRVIDHSPQRIDGSVVGDVTFGHTGVVGSSARMKNDDAHIEVSALSDFMPLNEAHVTAWGRSEREVSVTALNVFADVVVDGNNYSLSYSTNLTNIDWQYASLDYDGSRMELRYAQQGDREPFAADSLSVTGDLEDFELTFYTDGYGWVDDTRVYRTSLSQEHDNAIFDIGNDRLLIDEVGNAWDNSGLPFVRGQNNAKLASTLAEHKSYVLRQLDAIIESRHIQDAGGEQLDRIGQIANIRRKENEGDDKYRARIIATLAAGRSDGTFRDILNTTATILGTDVNRVEIEKQWQSQPTAGIATAEIFVRTVDIDNIDLTVSELTTILKDTVPAGHDIEITEQGANPFTVRNDTQANDSSLGLTSDGVQSGGGLVTDP